ncbi:HolA DNA polymerase III, delta subunit [Rhabdaerophilaceae bacterium]
MAVIRPADVDRLIARGAPDYPLILLFGPDEGLVRSRVRALMARILDPDADQMSRLELDADTINGDPERLLDEAHAIGMFGNRRVILVRQAGKLSKAAWSPLLNGPTPEAIIILQADDLAKNAALRIAAESNPQCATIACYALSAADLLPMIEARCRAADLSLTPPARALLVEQLGVDQGVSEQEIDKLILYCRGQLTIDTADVESIIIDTSGASAFDAIDLTFSGELPAIETAVSRALRDGQSPSGLIGQALGHVALLRRLAQAHKNRSLDSALRQERVFFKRLDGIRRQAETWTDAHLARATDILATAQAQARLVATLEEPIAIRALWAVALAARRR